MMTDSENTPFPTDAEIEALKHLPEAGADEAPGFGPARLMRHLQPGDKLALGRFTLLHGGVPQATPRSK